MARKGLFAALEELEGEGAGDGEGTVVIVDAGEDAHDENVVRETTDELEMSADQIANVTGTIDQATNTVDSLMAIGDELDKSAIPGVGIDEVSIKPTVIAVEALYRKLGLESYAFPALEAFSNTRTRVQATKQLRVSIEEKAEEAKSGIKKMAAKAWEMIQAFFKKIYEAIKNVFRPNAEKLLTRAKALKNDEPKEKDFKDNTIFKIFGEPGKGTVTPSDIKAAVNKLGKYNEGEDRILNYKFSKGEDGPIIKDVWEGKKVPEDAKVEHASKTELVALLENIISQDKEIANLEKEARKELDALKDNVDSKTHNEIVKVFNSVAKYSVLTIRYALSYANKSLKALEKKEDKTDDGKGEEGKKD